MTQRERYQCPKCNSTNIRAAWGFEDDYIETNYGKWLDCLDCGWIMGHRSCGKAPVGKQARIPPRCTSPREWDAEDWAGAFVMLLTGILVLLVMYLIPWLP